MKTNLLTITLALFMIGLTACKEEKPELKTVEYWVANQQEMMDFWRISCKDSLVDLTGDCKVVEPMGTSGVDDFTIQLANENYEAIMRERSKGR